MTFDRAKLDAIRSAYKGRALTVGLSDADLAPFSGNSALREAAEAAARECSRLKSSAPSVFEKNEADLIAFLQEGYLNFYSKDSLSPYVPPAARGPWVITTFGAVVHDSGGYGMIGHGHAPRAVLEAMQREHVMANVMTASVSQKNLMERLNREIGVQRKDGRPFDKFVCLNSGSEAVGFCTRIADVNAKILTDPGARHAGRQIVFLSQKGSFHGRTDRPAQASDSTYRKAQVLATFRVRRNLLTVRPNDCADLRRAFAEADTKRLFIEAMLLEPVMGEGNPGVATTPEFYRLARELTTAHGALLIVDSIQAGLRTQGFLSIVDYPGFEALPPPDLETYSKALNAGQYPLSIVAMSKETTALYRPGIYGNTMTTNPRALDVACAVLENVTPELRRNIVERGEEFVTKLRGLQRELGDAITDIQGTGLLFAASLNEERYVVVGDNCIEEYMRRQGIGVIHGGKNALRFTPHFGITSAEVDLVVQKTRDALVNGPRR